MPEEQLNFIRVSSPGQSHVDIACRHCGNVVPDSVTIQQAHLDWHEALREVIEAVRVLSSLAPGIPNISTFPGPPAADYAHLQRMASRNAACPACNHGAHWILRCNREVSNERGIEGASVLCECVYIA